MEKSTRKEGTINMDEFRNGITNEDIIKGTNAFHNKLILFAGAAIFIICFFYFVKDLGLKSSSHPKKLLTVKEILDSGDYKDGRNSRTYWEKVLLEDSEKTTYTLMIRRADKSELPAVGYSEIYYIVNGEPQSPISGFGQAALLFCMAFGLLMIAAYFKELRTRGSP